MTGIRLLIADDHAVVRAGLRALLESIATIAIVGEASNGEEAVQSVLELRPDVVLMDVSMALMNGLEATQIIKRESPRTQVIILSVHTDDAIVKDALRAGASGYLVKNATVAEFELAISAVVRGEVYLSSAISREVMEGYLKSRTASNAQTALLTPRQLEVLRLIGEGKNTKQIARQLKLSAKTIESHRAQVMDRLGVHDIANLILEASRRGLISLKK